MESFYNEISKNINKIDLNNKREYLKNIILDIKSNANNLFIFANGGSNSIADHLLIDFINRGVKCHTFNHSSIITCFANDYGYENHIRKIIELFVNKNDFVIFISSSGNSKNIINSVKYCNKNSIKYFSLSGFDKDNALNKLSDNFLWIDSRNYNVIESLHQIFLLSVVEEL